MSILQSFGFVWFNQTKCFDSFLIPPGAGGSSDERPEGAGAPEKLSKELKGYYHL